MELCKSVTAGDEKISIFFSSGRDLKYTDILKKEYLDIIMQEIAKEYEDIGEMFEKDDFDFNDYGIDEVLNHPERIDWEIIQAWISDSLLESFWEAMTEYPERDIIELLKEHPQYSILKDFDGNALVDYIYTYVSNVLGTSEESYELDGVDITEYVGSSAGEWDDFINTHITDAVIYDLEKMFKE